MRISKFLSAVCAAAFLTGSHAVRAQDTPAQAAARAALMQKMTELDAQQIQPTNSNPLASVVILPSAGQEQAVQAGNRRASHSSAGHRGDPIRRAGRLAAASARFGSATGCQTTHQAC